jgi:lipoprotein signal peptidase
VVGTLEQLVVMIFYYLKTKKPFFKWFFVVLLFIFFGACGSSRSVENRIIHADSIIVSSQLTPLSIKNPIFCLTNGL